MSSCLSNEGNDCVPWEIHSRETRGTLGRFRQSLPELQHSLLPGAVPIGLPGAGHRPPPLGSSAGTMPHPASEGMMRI